MSMQAVTCAADMLAKLHLKPQAFAEMHMALLFLFGTMSPQEFVEIS